MKTRILSLMAIAICISVSSYAQRAGAQENYRQAMNLYRNGMYERARTLVESVDDAFRTIKVPCGTHTAVVVVEEQG